MKQFSAQKISKATILPEASSVLIWTMNVYIWSPIYFFTNRVQLLPQFSILYFHCIFQSLWGFNVLRWSLGCSRTGSTLCMPKTALD